MIFRPLLNARKTRKTLFRPKFPRSNQNFEKTDQKRRFSALFTWKMIAIAIRSITP